MTELKSSFNEEIGAFSEALWIINSLDVRIAPNKINLTR
jgi:hypothetical protein